MQKTLSIFGVTGSIGASALKIWADNVDGFEIDTISGHDNFEALIAIAKRVRAKTVVVSEAHAGTLRDALGAHVKVLAGIEGLNEAASRKVDICLNAIIGAAGLPVSMKAAGNASILALANKESMVCAGELLRDSCAQLGTTIIPVDSEHSAIFQAIQGQDQSAISKVILTASGGPFRNWSMDQMRMAKLQDALKHPNWDMGARITIDSASMFNKALEMIEAQHLFELESAQIEVLVHPQSIVHSLVEFVDLGMLAQLGAPDMCHAIGYALHYPSRLPLSIERLDLAAIGRLDFEAPDEERFPALRLAREVMAGKGCEGAAFNAAKEIALDGFLAGKIGFLDMAKIVEKVMVQGDWNEAPKSIAVVEAADAQARARAKIQINKIL